MNRTGARRCDLAPWTRGPLRHTPSSLDTNHLNVILSVIQEVSPSKFFMGEVFMLTVLALLTLWITKKSALLSWTSGTLDTFDVISSYISLP